MIFHTHQNGFMLIWCGKKGVLFNEFDDIFSDLFQKRSQRYKDIILCIANGQKTVEDIAKALEREKGGDLSESLKELTQDGLISRDYSWIFKTGTPSKISQYRLCDNYLRFYLKYILLHRQRIEIDDMDALPVGWQSILGLQFENLVINNRRALHRLLNIPAQDIVVCNPYFQSATKKHPTCQIDYLIQTRFNTLYICEIKFSKTEITSQVINDMQEKIEKLVISKGFSIRPVLIHVNGVSDNLEAANFFANIINFADFLNINLE